jgi:hypothetical protein
MTALTINFTDSEALKNATVQALTGVLSPELKESLIKNAVEAMLVTPPKRNHYDVATPKSPLQDAFEQAIFTFSRELAGEMVRADPAMQQKLREAMHVAADKLFTGEAQYLLGEALADAFAKMLKPE